MNERVRSFEAEFRDAFAESYKVCFMSRAKELQIDASNKLKDFNQCAHALKEEIIALGDEDTANAMLSFEEATKAVINELNMWVALKDDNISLAWDCLVSSQVSAQLALKVHKVGNYLTSYIEHLHVLEHTLFPPQKFFSMRMLIKESTCSICGQEYRDCDHIKGQAYMGEICSQIVMEAEALDGLLVDNPADKHCRVISITDESGISRDFLTLRIKNFPDEQSINEFVEQLPNEPDPPEINSTSERKCMFNALAQLEKYIETDAKEADFQALLEENSWMFGSEYCQRLERRRWTRDNQLDFMLRRTTDRYLEMVEIKTPLTNQPLFIKDPSHGSHYPRSELTSVIAQVMHYLEELEAKRDAIKAEDGENVSRMRAKIIIGRDGDRAQTKTLHELNGRLSGIEILTFDQLVRIAKQVLDILSK